MKKDIQFEEIKSEKNDDYSDDSLFNIASWGADLSFREIITMYKEDELVKPELQRKYVWDKIEASRFIESLLMGLPVPSIFLAQSGSQKLIVDGYQRIMTVFDYVEGIFTGDGNVFKLSNSEKINERWRNKSFLELSMDEQRKIKSTTIHAIVFEQKRPANDDTSMYQIFERINTSGRTLTPQEIRNCVYQGTLNSLLFELNDYPEWRKLYGTDSPDSRMRDIECILRFFVMKSDSVQNASTNQISLKKSLNEFMGRNVSANEITVKQFKKDFERTMKVIYESIGDNAFRNYTNSKYSKKFNPALYDAVSIASYQALRADKDFKVSLRENHKLLFKNKEFIDTIKLRTTDVKNIKKRIELAFNILFEGNENEDGTSGNVG